MEGNPRLKAAMQAVAVDHSEETMRELFRQLIESEALVPVTGSTEEGATLAFWEDEEGSRTYCAFTDEQTLVAALPGDHRYVVMAGPTLAGLVLEDPGAAWLRVDPSTAAGGQLARHDLELIRDRLVPATGGAVATTGGVPLRFYELSEAPSESLLEGLALTAADVPGLTELRLFEGSWGGTHATHLLLGARFAPELDPGTRDSALAELGKSAQPHLEADRMLDTLELTNELYESASRRGRLVWPSDEAP